MHCSDVNQYAQIRVYTRVVLPPQGPSPALESHFCRYLSFPVNFPLSHYVHSHSRTLTFCHTPPSHNPVGLGQVSLGLHTPLLRRIRKKSQKTLSHKRLLHLKKHLRMKTRCSAPNKSCSIWKPWMKMSKKLF